MSEPTMTPAQVIRSALAEAHEESPGSDYDLDVSVEWVLDRIPALRATAAPGDLAALTERTARLRETLPKLRVRWEFTNDLLWVLDRLDAHRCPVDDHADDLRVRVGDDLVYVKLDADDLAKARENGPWYLDSNGYPIAGEALGRVRLHRWVLGLTSAERVLVDHKNGDILDSRRENLRVTDVMGNSTNLAVQNYRGTSRYRGVHWRAREGRWEARQRVDGKRFHLGVFANEEDAAQAVAEFRRANSLPSYECSPERAR